MVAVKFNINKVTNAIPNLKDRLEQQKLLLKNKKEQRYIMWQTKANVLVLNGFNLVNN